jgi:hypothetical protein
VLDPAAAPLTADDAAADGDGRISIRVELAGGGQFALEGMAGAHAASERDAAPTVVFLPAEARASTLWLKLRKEMVTRGSRSFGERSSFPILALRGLPGKCGSFRSSRAGRARDTPLP